MQLLHLVIGHVVPLLGWNNVTLPFSRVHYTIFVDDNIQEYTFQAYFTSYYKVK